MAINACRRKRAKCCACSPKVSLVTEIAKKLNRSIKTISSQKKSAMMKLGVENDIALLNYLSSVSLSATDKE